MAKLAPTFVCAAAALAALFAPTPAHAARFTLEFESSALGFVPLGAITLDLNVEDSAYSASARVQSGGLLSLFERTTIVANADGAMDNGAVRWRSYWLDHTYSRKHRTTAMQASDGGITSQITPTYRLWGEPPASDAQKAAARDPLSSLVAMTVDVARLRACNADYLTFDGRFLYRLELRGGAPDRVEAGGYDGPALRCTLRYVPVAGFEPDDAGRRGRVPSGEIWFALMDNVPFAPPVRMRLPVGIGSAHIALARIRRPEVNVDDTAAAPAQTP